MSREAMQMALDMLNEIADDVYCDQKLEGVITILRQALVDADDTSQERVDEMVKTEHDRAVELGQAYERGWNAALAQREWVGLTLNEAEDFYDKYTDRAELINAIDKFLEEKNHG